MGTSLSYNFANVDVDRIVRDAFAQCGINNSLISGWQYQMANDSLNFLLTSWLSKRGLNLFTVEQDIIQIIQGQRLYPLPPNTSKILECVFANANQIVDSAANYASIPMIPTSGTVQSIFQTVVGSVEFLFTTPPYTGSVSISYSSSQPIQYVGILIGDVAGLGAYSVQFTIQCSFDPDPPVEPASWITVLQIPQQTYYAGQIQWFSLPFTQNAPSWQISFTSTTADFTLRQILLEIPYNSLKMSRVGRDTYTFFPSNSQMGPSTTYYVNRAGQPTLDVWTTPDSQWEFFVYNRVRSIQDAGNYTNSLDMTPRFLEACTTGLAARLARLYAIDKAANLQATADQLFLEVAKEDTENVDIQMTIDSQGYYGS